MNRLSKSRFCAKRIVSAAQSWGLTSRVRRIEKSRASPEFVASGVPFPRLSLEPCARKVSCQSRASENAWRTPASKLCCIESARMSTGPRVVSLTTRYPRKSDSCTVPKIRVRAFWRSVANDSPAWCLRRSPAAASIWANGASVSTRESIAMTPPSEAVPHGLTPPPGIIRTLERVLGKKRFQPIQPPNGSLNGTPSTRSTERLAPFGPTFPRLTPCVVGWAAMLSVLRKRRNPGVSRRMLSSVRCGARSSVSAEMRIPPLELAALFAENGLLQTVRGGSR